VLELGDRLGPLLWQFAPFKKFEAADFEAFLAALPRERDGRRIRHVVEVRHASFRDPAFIALLRKHATPVVFAEHDTYPAIADVAGDFVYARLQKGDDAIATGYPPKELDAWAGRLRAWAEGGEPDLPRVDATNPPEPKPRDVFAYVIHEGKVRAPARPRGATGRADALTMARLPRGRHRRGGPPPPGPQDGDGGHADERDYGEPRDSHEDEIEPPRPMQHRDGRHRRTRRHEGEE